MGATTATELEPRILSPPDPEAEPRRIGALIAVTLLYMSILIFGQFVALGVMEEMQNRVVAVVLSRVEPAQLLIGKVAGIGALGLVQVVALGGSAWFALSLADVADISVSRLGGEIFLSVILWFLLGNRTKRYNTARPFAVPHSPVIRPGPGSSTRSVISRSEWRSRTPLVTPTPRRG